MNSSLQKTVFFFYLFLCLNNAFAQVKIGDNSTTINANSLLELESTNKGFLPPRVALVSVNSVTPLTSSTPAGMLVYSSGGAIADGYYFWNGSKWLGMSGSSSRNNMVIVKSMADLPSAAGGVITLSANTLYEINGAITVTASINLNGCNIRGADPVNDKLIYTGSGELFTGNGTGGIRLLTISAPSGKIFNINAGGANKNLLIQNCYFIGCNSIGTIQDIGGTVYMNSVAYFSNTNGITFQSCNYVVINNALWDFSNSNTYEKFIGSFHIIQILGGDRLVNSGNSATALNISALTSVTVGSIKVVMFTGNGTYVNGSFSKEWEIESSGLNTEKDDVASGNLYLSSVSITPFGSSNTPAKLNALTNSASLFRMTSTSNRLTYAGTKTKRFQVIGSLTGTPSSNNSVYSFYIAKNGAILPESKQSVKMSNVTDQQSITVSCTVSMAPTDYIEVWVSNDSNTGLLIVSTYNLAAK